MELKNYLAQAMTYSEYRSMLDQLLAEGKTTGPDQSEAMIAYAKLNQQRMQRIEKTIKLTDELMDVLSHLQKEITVLVISEGWCGDAAQIIPVFDAIQKNTNRFKVKMILRDEHLELIDAYLTNGGRAIPKAIFTDTMGNELAVWGPRPAKAQAIMDELKAKNASAEDKKEALHLWYGRDRTVTTQKELVEVLKELAN